MHVAPPIAIEDARRFAYSLGAKSSTLDLDDVETLTTWLASIIATTAQQHGDNAAGTILWHALRQYARGYESTTNA